MARSRTSTCPPRCVTGFAQDNQGITWASSNTRASGGGLWRFDGSSWQRIGAEWKGPDRPVAHVGFDRDGILWVLTGTRGPQAPTQLHFLAPGERRFRKVADNLFVLGFTRDADGNVLTTRERSRSGLSPSVEMEAPMPAYPILRKDSLQIIDRANAIWVISKDSVVLRRAATEPLEEAISKVSPGNSEGIPINPVLHASLVDREGTVWLGAPGAVHRFSHSPLVRLQLPAGAGSVVHAGARRRGGGVDQCGRWGRNVRPLPGHGGEGRSPTVDAGSVQLRLPRTGQGLVVRRRKGAVADGRWPPREGRAPEGACRGGEVFHDDDARWIGRILGRRLRTPSPEGWRLDEI